MHWPKDSDLREQLRLLRLTFEGRVPERASVLRWTGGKSVDPAKLPDARFLMAAAYLPDGMRFLVDPIKKSLAIGREDGDAGSDCCLTLLNGFDRWVPFLKRDTQVTFVTYSPGWMVTLDEYLAIWLALHPATAMLVRRQMGENKTMVALFDALDAVLGTRQQGMCAHYLPVTLNERRPRWGGRAEAEYEIVANTMSWVHTI